MQILKFTNKLCVGNSKSINFWNRKQFLKNFLKIDWSKIQKCNKK